MSDRKMRKRRREDIRALCQAWYDYIQCWEEEVMDDDTEIEDRFAALVDSIAPPGALEDDLIAILDVVHDFVMPAVLEGRRIDAEERRAEGDKGGWG